VSSRQSPVFVHQSSPEECEETRRPATTDKRWTQSETKLLLALRKENWLLFQDTKTKKTIVWRNIAQEKENQGVTVSKEQCSGKWKTLKAAYKRIKDYNRKTGKYYDNYINIKQYGDMLFLVLRK
jgi:hypothetical protein